MSGFRIKPAHNFLKKYHTLPLPVKHKKKEDEKYSYSWEDDPPEWTPLSSTPQKSSQGTQSHINAAKGLVIKQQISAHEDYL